MTARPRRCGDGLVHYVTLEFLKYNEPRQWLRICDCNDDNVSVRSLPLDRGSVTCVACVAKEPAEAW
jgi:hypothetical protein